MYAQIAYNFLYTNFSTNNDTTIVHLYSGSVTLNTLPLPSTLWTSIFPP